MPFFCLVVIRYSETRSNELKKDYNLLGGPRRFLLKNPKNKITFQESPDN